MILHRNLYFSFGVLVFKIMGSLLIFPPVVFSQESTVTTGNAVEFKELNADKKGAIGFGMAAVRFDTKIKLTDKTRGSVFIDPEKQLGLPEYARVNRFYAAFRFGKKHTLDAAYFAVKRDVTHSVNDLRLEDLIIVNGQATLSDDTKFYFLDYGYSFYQDDRSDIRGIIGIAGLDLKYSLDAVGDITIGDETNIGSYSDEVSVFAPLPLFGFDIVFAITSKWNISTKVALIAGSYEEIKASVFQTRINATYWFTKRIGGVIGITHFTADVVIEDDKNKDEISYAYGGAYFGLHFGF